MAVSTCSVGIPADEAVCVAEISSEVGGAAAPTGAEKAKVLGGGGCTEGGWGKVPPTPAEDLATCPACPSLVPIVKCTLPEATSAKVDGLPSDASAFNFSEMAAISAAVFGPCL